MSTKWRIIVIILIVLLSLFVLYLVMPKTEESRHVTVISTIYLPEHENSKNISVEDAIQNRRSIRHYTNQSLSLQDISQLMWAAQGITDSEKGFRTVPSGGHTYPLQVYVLVGNKGVEGLDSGLYHYFPQDHKLEKIYSGDLRKELSKAAHGQVWVENAPVDIIITGDYTKMIAKYKDERLSTRFVDMEAGHTGQNIYLEVESRNLATVSIGSFYEDQVVSLLQLPSNEKPLYIFPVGHPAKS